MNIWIINHYAGNPELGMEYRHFFLARHLKKQNYQVSLISSSFHHLYTVLPQTDGIITFQTFERIPFAFVKTPYYEGNNINRLLNMIAFSLRLKKYYNKFEQTFGKPDIVLGSSPHPFVVINLLHLKKIYKIPVLFEVRDLWPLMLIELGSISSFHPLSLLFSYLEKKGFKQCDRVISLMHSAHTYMIKHGLDSERYFFLPNGVEINSHGGLEKRDFSHPLIEKVCERKKLGKFIVGYAGSHGSVNPIKCIVKTCALLRERGLDDVEFFLVGNGLEKEKTVSLTKNLGLTNIYFHSAVKRDVIMAFYEKIDVAFVGLRDLPSFRYGTSPNKLMDYMAAGKPVIYAVNSSFDPVKKARAGISIPADNAEKLVEAILELKKKSAEELASMGIAGRNYAKNQFDFKTLAEKLAALSLDCIGERKKHM